MGVVQRLVHSDSLCSTIDKLPHKDRYMHLTTYILDNPQNVPQSYIGQFTWLTIASTINKQSHKTRSINFAELIINNQQPVSQG